MKKKLAAVMAVLVCGMLTGCGGGVVKPNKVDYRDYNTPNISVVREDDSSNGYYYIIDNNTEVVYLAYKDNDRSAITVMFKADGTPLTVNDILKKGK